MLFTAGNAQTTSVYRIYIILVAIYSHLVYSMVYIVLCLRFPLIRLFLDRNMVGPFFVDGSTDVPPTVAKKGTVSGSYLVLASTANSGLVQDNCLKTATWMCPQHRSKTVGWLNQDFWF